MVGLPEKDSSFRDKRPGGNQGQPQYREQMCSLGVRFGRRTRDRAGDTWWKEQQHAAYAEEMAGVDIFLNMGGCVGEVRREEKRPLRFTDRLVSKVR